VRLAVYNALGQEVRVLHDGPMSAGNHEAAFDANSLPSGIYFARLATDIGAQTHRLTLVR
jgi:hypothetical protein